MSKSVREDTTGLAAINKNTIENPGPGNYNQ